MANVSGTVDISLQAWGSNHRQKSGYVKLNGQLVRDTSYDIRDKHHTYQGLHLATILRGWDGSVRIGKLERFDNEQEQEVKRLAEFLRTLSKGDVIMGVDAGGTESDLSEASALLSEFGVNVDDLDIGEAMAFIAIQGDAGAVQMKSSDSQVVNVDVKFESK